eukprot:188781_1
MSHNTLTVRVCVEPEDAMSTLDVEYELQGKTSAKECTQRSISPETQIQEKKVPVLAVSRLANREWLVSTLRAGARNALYGIAWEFVFRTSPVLLRMKLPEFATLFSAECLKTAARRGAMLGSWVTLFRVLSRVTQCDLVERRLSNHSEARTCVKQQFYAHSYRLAISAFISGFVSVRLFPGISWQMTVYFACRAARAILDVECKRGSTFLRSLVRVPTWLWFAFTVGPGIGHFLTFKPLFVPRGYMDFMGTMGRSSAQKMHDIFNHPGAELIPCNPVFHVGHCRTYVIDGLRYAALKSFRFFFTFYAITRVIIRSPHALLRAPFHSMRSLIKSALCSSIFVVSVSWGGTRMPCLLRPFLKKLNPINTIPFLIISCSALFFESESRQMEIFIYNVSILFETILNVRFGMNVRARPPIKTPRRLAKLVAPLLFGLASSAWVCARQVSVASLKPTEKLLLNNVLPLHEKSVRFDEAQLDLQRSPSTFQLAVHNLLRK